MNKLPNVAAMALIAWQGLTPHAAAQEAYQMPGVSLESLNQGVYRVSPTFTTPNRIYMNLINSFGMPYRSLVFEICDTAEWEKIKGKDAMGDIEGVVKDLEGRPSAAVEDYKLLGLNTHYRVRIDVGRDGEFGPGDIDITFPGAVEGQYASLDLVEQHVPRCDPLIM